MPGRFWTVAELLTLEALRLERKTAAEIAAVLGRTEKAVSEQARRGDFSLASVDAEWVEALRSGKPAKQIAAERGVTMRAVDHAKWRLRRGGFNIPRCRFGPKPRTNHMDRDD